MSRVRLLTPVALALLLAPLAGCSSASTAVEACMGKQAVGATSGELAGEYAGEGEAKGVTITLTPSEAKPGSGRVTVHNWPTGDWYKGELGETFDGSGSWAVIGGGNSAAEHAYVALSFTTPERFLEGDTLDRLSIAGDGARVYLYEDDDPDVCPAFRLRKQSR
ncbi:MULTISPECIES: hypothetical protein [Streptomyces]|uniref:Lipoprotein n=2 Tax=Streptomyces TaxID=1883 RepID=A0A2U9P431_STRAS|nr:hypothetical protein [Streptomyces actuosus]AWT43798.1 hypothetical protein DMT42_16715 [Streptomyces actuosus]MBM4821077.1 hypothetical protein [Streptomyces actuosus]